MGLVRCERHGEQQGPLCCRHVLDASYGTPSPGPVADPGALVFICIDLFDDASEMLDIVLCQVCAVQYGRGAGDVLASEHLGDDRALPWICPICNPCLERWTGHPTIGWSNPALGAG